MAKGVLKKQPNALQFESYANTRLANKRKNRKYLEGYLSAYILVRPPSEETRKRMDVHNYHKLLLDVLTVNQVYRDDSQITYLQIGFSDSIPTMTIPYIRTVKGMERSVDVCGGCAIMLYEGTANAEHNIILALPDQWD